MAITARPPVRPYQSWGQQAAANGPDPVTSVGGALAAPGHLIIKALTATAPNRHGGPVSAGVNPAAEAAAKAASGRARSTAPATPAAKPGLDVAGMQRFLSSKGYQIPVDGLNGPLTQAAAAAFRSHADPSAFNVSHGLVHDQAGPAQTDASSSGPVSDTQPTQTVPKTRLPAGSTGTQFYTTAAQAKQALAQPTDIVGQVVKFQAGKGYYLGAGRPGAAGAGAGASGASSGAPTSDATTAQQVIAAIINPLITSIKQAEAARAAQGQNLINGYTTNAQQQLKSIDFGAPYQDATQGQNAVNTALLAALRGQGAGDQNQLAGELASLGSPATAAAVGGQAAADTTGAANAGLASGDATLSQLLSQGAAAKTYGNKLPGVEALAGSQDTAKLQGAVTADQASQLQQIQSKVPGMVQSELAALSSARTAQQKNEIAALIAAGKTGTALKIAQGNNATKLAIAGANNQTRKQIAAQNAALKAAGLQTKGQPTDAQISKLIDGWKTGKLQSVTTIARDSNGNPIPNSAGAPETTTQTVPTGQLNYTQAYQRLRSFGKTDQQARTLLNTVYQRGVQGRAWITNEEQHALTAAKLPAKATVINGHGVLTPKQYQALKAAQQLPPGTLTAEGAYVIKPGF